MINYIIYNRHAKYIIVTVWDQTIILFILMYGLTKIIKMLFFETFQDQSKDSLDEKSLEKKFYEITQDFTVPERLVFLKVCNMVIADPSFYEYSLSRIKQKKAGRLQTLKSSNLSFYIRGGEMGPSSGPYVDTSKIIKLLEQINRSLKRISYLGFGILYELVRRKLSQLEIIKMENKLLNSGVVASCAYLVTTVGWEASPIYSLVLSGLLTLSATITNLSFLPVFGAALRILLALSFVQTMTGEALYYLSMYLPELAKKLAGYSAMSDFLVDNIPDSPSNLYERFIDSVQLKELPVDEKTSLLMKDVDHNHLKSASPLELESSNISPVESDIIKKPTFSEKRIKSITDLYSIDDDFNITDNGSEIDKLVSPRKSFKIRDN